jgi:transcriptional regulator with XRE-family HTH domain
MRQVDVADTAGVSQALVSAIEHGNLDQTSLGSVRRVASAVGVSLAFEPRWRGADLPRLLDERHAAVVQQIVTRLTALAWTTLPEHTFSIRGERGSVDVLAWRPARRAALVIEVKTQIVDMQEMLSTFDRKRRLLSTIVRDLGWKPLAVGALLVMPEETQARHAVARYRPLFDATYPDRGRSVRAWLLRPEHDLRGLWFLNFIAGDARQRRGGVFRVRPKHSRPPRVVSRSESGGSARIVSDDLPSDRGRCT